MPRSPNPRRSRSRSPSRSRSRRPRSRSRSPPSQRQGGDIVVRVAVYRLRRPQKHAPPRASVGVLKLADVATVSPRLKIKADTSGGSWSTGEIVEVLFNSGAEKQNDLKEAVLYVLWKNNYQAIADREEEFVVAEVPDPNQPVANLLSADEEELVVTEWARRGRTYMLAGRCQNSRECGKWITPLGRIVSMTGDWDEDECSYELHCSKGCFNDCYAREGEECQ